MLSACYDIQPCLFVGRRETTLFLLDFKTRKTLLPPEAWVGYFLVL